MSPYLKLKNAGMTCCLLAFCFGCKEPTVNNAPALLDAIERNDQETIEQLLSDPRIVNQSGEKGVTPVLQALRHSRKSLYERLLKMGGDPNLWDEQGNTAVHEAAAAEDPDWLRIALLHRGDPNNLGYFDGSGGRMPPLFTAIGSDRKENVSQLTKNGANVNYSTQHGQTPLLQAVQAGSYEIAAELLEVGADPFLPNKSGDTAAKWMAEPRRAPGEDDPEYGSFKRVTERIEKLQQQRPAAK